MKNLRAIGTVVVLGAIALGASSQPVGAREPRGGNVPGYRWEDAFGGFVDDACGTPSSNFVIVLFEDAYQSGHKVKMCSQEDHLCEMPESWPGFWLPWYVGCQGVDFGFDPNFNDRLSSVNVITRPVCATPQGNVPGKWRFFKDHSFDATARYEDIWTDQSDLSGSPLYFNDMVSSFKKGPCPQS